MILENRIQKEEKHSLPLLSRSLLLSLLLGRVGADGSVHLRVHICEIISLDAFLDESAEVRLVLLRFVFLQELVFNKVISQCLSTSEKSS